MQFLSYYGPSRAVQAAREAGFEYVGLVATTPWVPFQLAKAREVGADGSGTLANQLSGYAAVEAIGGERYHCHPTDQPLVTRPSSSVAGEEVSEAAVFTKPLASGLSVTEGWAEERLSAAETLALVEAAGMGAEPLCQWQCHLFKLRGL
jgi:hypothetical protein